MIPKRLKYEKYNNSNDAIIINLHNGYSVIAITGFNTDDNYYLTSLFLKDNVVDRLDLIEGAANLIFYTTQDKIHSAILKKVSKLLETGFFNHYIKRCKYEMDCFEKGCELSEIGW